MLLGMTQCDEQPDPWKLGICRANGIDIHYRRTGKDKPPLVALHGLMGSGACLLPLAEGLEAGFDVILPDARGHGKSSALAAGHGYDELARDIRGLIEALALIAPILVGHSMGGMTATVAASELGAALRALVLIDPTFISPERQREVYESNVAAEHRRSIQAAREDLIDEAQRRCPNRPADLIARLVDARLRTSPAAFEVLTPPNPDWEELIANIAAPILLLIGDRGIVSLDTARHLRSLNPRLRYAVISDAGHGLPYDRPAELCAAIRAFLEEGNI